MPGGSGAVGQPLSLDLGKDGVAASHPLQIDFLRFVAPSLASDTTHNTVAPFLIVVGCASVPDVHFKFDHSFVVPEAKESMIRLAAMRDQLADPDGPPGPDGNPTLGAKPPLSIFGHADPEGSDAYNTELSQRRARAIYAMLVRDVAEWEKLIDQPHSLGGDHWGKDEYAQMADTTGTPPKPAFSGAERKALIKAYMDAVCVRRTLSGTEEAFELKPQQDFLARGADKANRKGDVQGCGEFNPTFIMSTQRRDDFEKRKDEHGRDEANKPDRRVIAFLFQPGSQIKPAAWPCPHVHDRNAGAVCKGRFWSDGETRRKADPEMDKQFDTQQRVVPPADPSQPTVLRTPTFACRFYHGIAQNSPCEGIVKQWVLRILRGPHIEGKDDRPFARERFVVTMGDSPDAPQIRGRTDDEGVIRLPVFDEQATMLLKLDTGDVLLPPGVDPPDDRDKQQRARDEKDFSPFTLKAGALLPINVDGPSDADPNEEALKQRLFNLGYGKDPIEQWDDDERKTAVRAFQRNEKLSKKDGVPDPEMRQKLEKVHDHLPADAQAQNGQ